MLALIGLDACDLDYVRAHLADLPNLARAFASGALSELDSTAYWLTGSVWPTFYTGKHPGHHGVYHNLQWDAAAMRLRRVARDWLDYEPFWSDLEARGLRALLLDLPMSYAPRLRRGLEVVNWGAHDQLAGFASNRAAVGDEIQRRFGPHPMGNEVPVDKTAAQRQKILDELLRGARMKADLACSLLDREPWDVFVTVFGETHRGGHILWPGDDVAPSALLDVHRAIDDGVGRIRARLPAGSTLVLFALHGMAANESQEQFVAPILERLNRRDGEAPQRSPLRWLRDRLPAGVQQAIAGAVPAAVRDWVVNGSLAGGRDWSRTPALPLHADLNGYLRVNLAGRERDGAVREREPHLASLRAAFESFRHSDGTPLVAEIADVAAVYPGPRAVGLPDLSLRWSPAPAATDVSSPELGTIRARRATGRGGNHAARGFWLVDPPPRDGIPAPRHITDLADTIRALVAA